MPKGMRGFSDTEKAFCIKKPNEGGRAGKIKQPTCIGASPSKVRPTLCQNLKYPGNTPRLTEGIKTPRNTNLTLVFQIKFSGDRKTPLIAHKIVEQIQEKREEVWHKKT